MHIVVDIFTFKLAVPRYVVRVADVKRGLIDGMVGTCGRELEGKALRPL